MVFAVVVVGEASGLVIDNDAAVLVVAGSGSLGVEGTVIRHDEVDHRFAAHEDTGLNCDCGGRETVSIEIDLHGVFASEIHDGSLDLVNISRATGIDAVLLLKENVGACHGGGTTLGSHLHRVPLLSIPLTMFELVAEPVFGTFDYVGFS